MQDFSDPDLLAMQRRRFPFVGVLLGLIVLAAAAFVFGYYMPLFSAHKKLAAEHETLAKNARSVADELGRTQEELKHIEQEKSKLSATVTAADELQKSVSDRVAQQRQTLETALGKRIKQHWVALTSEGKAVIVRIPTSVLFAPNSLNLTRHGAQLLCEATGALGTGDWAIAVGAHAEAAEVSSAALAKTYKTAWDLTAAQAAAAAAALADQCKVDAARITASAFANARPIAGGDVANNARVELRVEL